MQCLTEERDSATITWKKDGMTLSGGGGRVTINSQTLQIFNLQREDYGVYQCFVTRGVREVQATARSSQAAAGCCSRGTNWNKTKLVTARVILAEPVCCFFGFVRI